MWDLIVSVPDHCLSFYFVHTLLKFRNTNIFIRHLPSSGNMKKICINLI